MAKNKNIANLHIPDWRVLSGISVTSFAAGASIAYDLRNAKHSYNNPIFYYFASASSLQAINPRMDGMSTTVVNPGMSGTFGAGSAATYVPSAGPRGTIAAGATSTTFTPSATLGATVGINNLATRGDGIGFVVRIIDNGVGGTGKTEERYIIENTSSATPLIRLNSALSFVPVTGSSFEILCGRVFMLNAGVLAAGSFKSYDVSINTMSGNLATTNLPATIGTDTNFTSLDEQYVPATRKPGEGFIVDATVTAGTNANGVTLNALKCTGTPTSTTITGQATGGDVAVLANEFRNFQIRIVEDTTTPAAVGQRRIIASHTAGPSAVYTVSTAFTVTPSTAAKYVIEYPNYILCFTSASATTYTYAWTTIGAQTADTWSTTTFAASASAVGAGVMSASPFGITLDTGKNIHYSDIFRFRGGNVSNMDILDIAAGANGVWTNSAVYGQIVSATFTTGSCAVYDPYTFGGKYMYINLNGGQYFYRFNMKALNLVPATYLKYAQSTAVVGQRIALKQIYDFNATLSEELQMSELYLGRSSGTETFGLVIPNE